MEFKWEYDETDAGGSSSRLTTNSLAERADHTQNPNPIAGAGSHDVSNGTSSNSSWPSEVVVEEKEPRGKEPASSTTSFDFSSVCTLIVHGLQSKKSLQVRDGKVRMSSPRTFKTPGWEH